MKTASVIALITLPALIHLALFHSSSRILPFALLTLQLGSLAIAFAPRSKLWAFWLLAALGGGGAGFLAWRFGPEGAVVSSGLPHAAIHLALIALFGSSLIEGREPLVTGIMRRVRGPLQPELLRYGRQVTMLWCGASAAQLLISAILLLTAPLATWSFFINILSVPLVIALFASEFVYHTIRFRHLPHSRLTDVLKAVRSLRSPVPARHGTAG